MQYTRLPTILTEYRLTYLFTFSLKDEVANLKEMYAAEVANLKEMYAASYADLQAGLQAQVCIMLFFVCYVHISDED